MSKQKYAFGDNYSTIDPDKSDKDYKNFLCDYLVKYGANGYTYSYAKVVGDGKDVLAWTFDTGEEHMYEVKGTSEGTPLIQVYQVELIEAIKNPGKYWFAIIRKIEGMCQAPLFLTVNQVLEAFPLQGISVKGTLNINGLTQEMVDGGLIPKTKRRNTTLMANKEMILEHNDLRNKHLDGQCVTSNNNIFKFCVEDESK